MRIFTFFAFVLLASFSVPVVVSAQSADGVGCISNSDCISGYCTPGNVSSRVCATNTAGGTNNGGGTAIGGTNTGTTLVNPLKAGTSLESFLRDILSFVIRIGTIVVILMLVFVGFKFVTARGEPGKITEARGMLLWTIVGALVLLGAQAISSGIQATVQSLGG